MADKSASKMKALIKSRIIKPTAAYTYEKISERTLPDCFTFWDRVTREEVERFEEVLDNAKDERPMQAFFQVHRHLLAEHLHGGHARWVIPQKRLGAEHVPDFIIGEAHSFGHTWFGVELESPRKKPFNKNGDPSAILTHAIRQITDWREWLMHNLDYASREESKQGLGLFDIRPNLDSFIILGRRDDYPKSAQGYRQQMKEKQGITIRSYDFYLDTLKQKCGYAEHLKAQARKRKTGASKPRSSHDTTSH